MKAFAIAFLVATGACAIKTPGTPSDLVARREHVRNHQILFGVGLAAGLVVTAVGVALAAHGVELRGRETTADDEAGIPSLLGGFLLMSTGGLAAIGSGIGLGVSTHERSKINEQIRNLSPVAHAADRTVTPGRRESHRDMTDEVPTQVDSTASPASSAISGETCFGQISD